MLSTDHEAILEVFFFFLIFLIVLFTFDYDGPSFRKKMKEYKGHTFYGIRVPTGCLNVKMSL